MELWIRNQNKQKLAKVNELNILDFADFVAIRGCINQETSFWLGNYKTKERALEVLDEIQHTLLGNSDYNYTNPATLSNITNKIIYEMPEE